jgi:hypothetical protein
VTDANVVLARIDPSRPIGMSGKVSISKARAPRWARWVRRSASVSRGDRRGDPRGVNSAWQDASPALDRARDTIRAISLLWRSAARVRVHGAALMQEVGIGAMLVRPIRRARAMAVRRRMWRYDYSRTVERLIAELEPGDVRVIMREQRAEGETQVRASEAPVEC